MKIKYTTALFTSTMILFLLGCSRNWTRTLHSGNVTPEQFVESVDVDIRKDLVFVPVTIEGKEYNFLLDTGAPFSISKKLQDVFNYKVVSKSTIRDSDRNYQQVQWAKVPAIRIGEVVFTDHTAFIGDFEANPILKCLEIDGIVGSNLMRKCNWTVDQTGSELIFYKNEEGHDHTNCIIVPFSVDQQFNMFMNINVGRATVKNVLVDYGSNGSISLKEQVFSTLKDMDIIKETMVEKGQKTSGIIGNPVDLNREFLYSDSVSIDSIFLEQMYLRTAHKSSIGTGLLSRFTTTIDWDNRQLHFSPTDEAPEPVKIVGFGLGYSSDQGLFIQSIIEPSNAQLAGVRPNMKVTKVDDLDFEAGDGYCEYVYHEFGDKIFVEAIDSLGQKRQYHIERTRVLRK